MNRPIFFCKSWFAARKIPTEVWTEQQAKDAHDIGKNYTVLVDSVEKPFCVILVLAKAVVVDFLDKEMREALSYQFQEVSPGRMFLTLAVYREYDGDEDKVIKGTSYKFAENGKLRIDIEDFLPERDLKVAYGQTDVSSNYIAAPAFGKYEEFMRMERQLN